MKEPSPKVDGFIRKQKLWQAELQALRLILLDTPLTEEIKWRVPCYTLEAKNVVLLGSFKASAVISFVKGVLLKDPKKILMLPGENSQSARIVRCTSVEQINSLAATLKAYVREAIELEKSGAKVELKKSSDFAMPQEFDSALKNDAALKKAFAGLTPGRQRGYLLYFSSAKQSATRTARVEKVRVKILTGKGLEDE